MCHFYIIVLTTRAPLSQRYLQRVMKPILMAGLLSVAACGRDASQNRGAESGGTLVVATAEDPGTSRGSAGKRVWNVLRF